MAREVAQLNDSVYEFYRPPGRVEVEYVFFHGLCFSEYIDAYKTTWEVEDGSGSVLRDMIPKEFPRARVLSVSYDACAKVSDEAGRMNFSNLGTLLVQDIIHLAKVGQRGCPVVLVGFCLGGLIIKQLCTAAEKQFDRSEDGSSKGRLGKFLASVKVIKFIDTPHAGSGLGDFLRELLSKSDENCGPVLEYLSKSSPSLGQLNSDFDYLATEREWKRYSWWYCEKTVIWESGEKKFNLPSYIDVVSEPSARRGMDEVFLSIPAAHSRRALTKQSHWYDYMEAPRTVVGNLIKEAVIPRITRAVYEFYRPVEECEVEFVFFHGLCFSKYRDAYKKTWELNEEGRYWIRDSIPDRFPRARVLAVSYDSRAKISDTEEIMIMSFSELGKVLVDNIIHVAKVGQRGCPVVLVGYCLGGLILKQVCTEAKSQLDQALPGLGCTRRLDQFLTSVKGIEYLDTPHGGSILGTHLKNSEGANGLVLEYLTESSEVLNKDFDELAGAKGWEQRFVWYRNKTRVWSPDWSPPNVPEIVVNLPDIQVVEEESAIRGQGKLIIDADHSGRALSNHCDEFIEFLTDFVAEILRKGHDGKVDKRAKIGCFPVRLDDSLYEIYRPAEEDVKMELIFFPRRELREGYVVDGDAYKTTWMSESGQFWLQDWLPEAFPEARILSTSYNLDSSEDLEPVGENLISNITSSRCRKGQIPVVLVGHSSGGLVIKELCCQAEKREEGAGKDFLRDVRGIAYYGTTYSSSMLEDFETSTGNLSYERARFEKELQRRNVEYKQLLSKLEWKELVLGETRPTEQGSRKGMINDDFSASNGILRNSFFPLPADHLTICKPKSQKSNSFQYLVHFIRTTMNEAQYVNMNVRRGKRRGIAIIISMEKTRPGSPADRIRLQDMAENTSLEFIGVVDQRPTQIPSIIEEILREELQPEDECILCCVAAHGCVDKDGKQLITDNVRDPENVDKPIEHLELFDILKPIYEHHYMAGKPKVFVVNACRVSEDNDATTDLKQERNDLEGDCLLMYSTELYTESIRRENGYEEGSFLLLKLTDTMRLLHETTDVEDIFKTVQEKVAEAAAAEAAAAQKHAARAVAAAEAAARVAAAATVAEAAEKVAAKAAKTTATAAERVAERARAAAEEEKEVAIAAVAKAKKIVVQSPVIHSTLRRRLSWRSR